MDAATQLSVYAIDVGVTTRRYKLVLVEVALNVHPRLRQRRPTAIWVTRNIVAIVQCGYNEDNDISVASCTMIRST